MNTSPIPSALATRPVWSVEAFNVTAGPKMLARSPDNSLLVEVVAPAIEPGSVAVRFTRYGGQVPERPVAEWVELLTVARELVRRITEGKQ